MRTSTMGLLMCAASGCLFDSALPDDAVVACTTSADCLVGQACAAAGRCVDVDAIDERPPALVGATLSPARAGPGMRIDATVRFDEELGAPAALSMSSGDARYAFTPSDDGYRLTVDASMPSGAYAVDADATDLNLNRIVVEVGVVEVDTTGPVVLSVEPEAAFVAVGEEIAVGVTLDDDDATADGVATERASGETLALTSRADGRVAATASVEGTWDIVVAGTDDLGNRGAPRGGVTVAVDGTAPALLDADVEIVAPPDARRADVTAATAGSVVRVSFVIDEDAAQVPEVGFDDDASAPFTLEAGEARLFRFTTTVAAQTAEGDRVVSARVVDEVGNVAVLALGTVRVDRTPPPPPDGLAYTYTRRPWRFDDDERFSVDGAPGAAAAGARVLAVDPNDVAALPLAQADADEDGASHLVLPPLDRVRASVIEVDEAGNASPPSLVRRVLWTASYGAKVPGDRLTNPHRAVVLDGVPRAPLDRRVQARTELGDELAIADGVTGDATPVPTWRAIASLAGPAFDFVPRASYDPQRGEALLINLATLFGDPLPLPYTFDGQWVERTLLGTRPSFVNASLVPDLARGTMLLVDSNTRSWVLDGTTSVQRGVLPRRDGIALAADVDARTVIAFGGSDPPLVPTTWFNDTFRWNGVSWTQVDTGGVAPSPRSSRMAFDPVRGGLLLFGGVGADGALNDTWHFDGAAWTELTPADAPPAVGHVALLSDPDGGRVLLVGEQGTWAWDGVSWTLDPLEPPPTVTPGLFSGAAAVWSGVDDAPLYFRSGDRTAHRADGSSWQQVGANVVFAPPATRVTIAADPPRGGALVSVGGVPLLDAHLHLSESGYRRVSAASGPTALGSVSTYDAAHEVVLLVSQGATWLWDGAWTNAGAAPDLVAVTYDPADPAGGHVVGVGASGTFAWTGDAWLAIGPAPPGIAGEDLAYDPVSDALLYLEDRINDTPLAFTLARGAASWEPASTEGVLGCSFSVALDEAAGRVLLTGGSTPVSCVEFVGCFGGDVLDTTLEWNGSAWEQLTLERAYTSRSTHRSAYVPDLGGVVVTEGTASDVYVFDRAPRAATLFELSVAAAALPLDAIVRLSPRVDASAQGGATLSGFETYPGRFTTLAASPADTHTLSTDVTDAQALRGLLAGPAVVFLATGARGGAPLGVDAASLEVEFLLAQE